MSLNPGTIAAFFRFFGVLRSQIIRLILLAAASSKLGGTIGRNGSSLTAKRQNVHWPTTTTMNLLLPAQCINKALTRFKRGSFSAAQQ